MNLHELSSLISGRTIGNPDTVITGVAGLEEAKAGDITYLVDKKNLKEITSLKASAIIAKQEIEGLSSNWIIVDNPQFAFAKTLEIFYKPPTKPSGISEQAVIGSNVSIGSDVSIHPLAFIGDDVEIGTRVTIMPGVYVGSGVKIGDDCCIYPNVTIRENVILGNNVIIQSGAVIGSDGFGYVLEKGEHYKIPQVGGVIIEDSVEIGANVTIDKATLGYTIIGRGTKIDNLVQVAHNVRIGKNCIIISQVGISGSVEIGDNAILAGQVGVRDHVKIGPCAIIGSQSGIANDIPEGQVFSGTPAIPHKTWLRAQSVYSRLPEYVKRLQKLERTLETTPEKDHDD